MNEAVLLRRLATPFGRCGTRRSRAWEYPYNTELEFGGPDLFRALHITAGLL